MKTNLRYQNGFLYEHHGAWYVRYYQRTPKEDGTRQLNHACKHLGRSKDFRNISDVELCRASFMQTINRDQLSANSRITLTSFVEGVYLPWTKEERRASTSKGHREIWINHSRPRRTATPAGISHRGCQSNATRDSPSERSHHNDIATYQVGFEHHLHLCQE